MNSPDERGPFEREAEEATEQTNEGSSKLADTDETEMSGSAEPGTTATPEGTSEVSD